MNTSTADPFSKEGNRHFKHGYLTLLTFLVTAILLSFSIRSLIAEYYFRRVERILDDKATEYLDLKPISGETISSYMEAIRSLNMSIEIYDRAVYYKRLSDIFMRLGKWAEVMEEMNSPLPDGTPKKRESYENAVKYIKHAIELEPTNPDYHLVLAQLYESVGADEASSDMELVKAINAYPINASLRYAVAKHYLLGGRSGDALEHARVLANIDDTYIMRDSFQKRLMIESMSPAYLNRIYKSYLFSALEIAWRASGDPDVVKGIAPDNPDARVAVDLFLEWKGL